MTFHLSARSLQALRGVDPTLVAVVRQAIRLTGIDFVVIEGLRTKDRQRQLVAAGKSKTMKSRHLTGHAVDLAAIDPATGEISWSPGLYYQIASAMILAAKQSGPDTALSMRWGAIWDKPLGLLPDSPVRLKLEVDEYRARRKGKAFIDMPHFEIAG